MALPVPTKSF